MPFRYLESQVPDREESSTRSPLSYDTTSGPNFSSPFPFQIPSFICNGPPELAPGGGAEVLTPSDFYWLNNNISNISDSGNNVFTSKLFDESFLRSSSKTQFFNDDAQLSSQAAPNAYDYQPLSAESSTSYPSSILASYNNSTAAPNHPSAAIRSSGVAGISSETPAISSACDFILPSTMGLPVYSASGFDLMSILARVATRPNPKVVLGPVDMTCSFVVVDIRRHDCPIVYCSPSFCHLTGYEESEVLGKNCRFLQSPDGIVSKGQIRRHTAHDAVVHLKKNLSADKECQTSLINYKKGGAAFINLVSVIPIAGGVSGAAHEKDEVVYHIGFQVDLTEQPNVILQKVKDGSYIVDYGPDRSSNLAATSRKIAVGASHVLSRELQALLADPSFIQSLPLSSSTIAAVAPSTDKPEIGENNRMLNLLLLENLPDFVHVVSLKGLFLYVAPSVRNVLGYDPEELAGKYIADIAHPADVVPITRELKESSATPGVGGEGQVTVAPAPGHPKIVDLLFRARTKKGVYVWVECRGRLYVEPGKGRKAIILSGRAREMSTLAWSSVAQGGGLEIPEPRVHRGEGRAERENEKEFWGTISAQGKFLSASSGVRDVIGWNASDLTGRAVGGFVVGEENSSQLEEAVAGLYAQKSAHPQSLLCWMLQKDGGQTQVQVVLHRPFSDGTPSTPFRSLIYQVKLATQSPTTSSLPLVSSLAHSQDADVFEEMDTARGSSWQYELQQLKFANQRLADEIKTLETAEASSTPPHSEQQLYSAPQQALYHPQMSMQQPTQPDWGVPAYYYRPPPTSKRSWAAMSEPAPT